MQLGHLGDDAGEHRLQPTREREEVRARVRKERDILRIGEIQPAGHTGKDEAEREHVGQLVMMTDDMLPSGVTGQINRPRDLGVGAADIEVRDVLRKGVDVRLALRFADDFESA